LDSEFTSNFNVDLPDERCHSLMHDANDEYQELIISYALALSVEDFIVCAEDGQRPMTALDLQAEDYINPAN